MKIILHGNEYHVHDKSPMIGDIVRCTDKSRHLIDPLGYKVEQLGLVEGFGQEYGSFGARGLRYGGLYFFTVDEYELLTPAP
jgi:hypothetical protein